MDKLPDLKVVSNMAVGYDNIDVPAATERGLAVCTTPDVLTDTTAEFGMALIFAVAKQVVPAARAAAEGDWKTWYPMRFLGRDLLGATLGIVGLGRIGRRVAEMGAALGMQVIYADAFMDDDEF
jgi:glyoxylate reductase